METDLVSVIVPTYNRAEILTGAVYSALCQTYDNIEVLIIDDCSTDNTKAVIESFQDPRVRYCHLTKNSGAPTARNHGIQNALGKYIAFLDSDDTWHCDKIALQINLLKELGDDYGAAYCGVSIADKYGKPYLKIIPEKQGDIFLDMLIKNWVGSTSVLMAKTNLIRQVGGFDVYLPACQDWDLFIRLSKITKFAYVPRVLMNYFEFGTPKRISNDRNKVYRGHCMITQKHASEILKLSNKEQAKHYEYLANRMRDTKIYSSAIFFALKAALISRSIRYVFVASKYVGSYLKWTLTTY